MEKRIDGRTGLLALFGTPVGHSGSPAMYNFSFQHDGLNLAYMAFDVNIDQMPATFEAIKLFNIRGGNFTMPCKNIASELCDELDPAAKIIGACNTFVNNDGVVKGYITDGVGCVNNLANHGVEVKGKKVVVLGAGGAATAVQVQLSLEGAKEVHVFNRDDSFFERALGTQKKIAQHCPDVVFTVDHLEDADKLAAAINDADILINATIVGMKPLDDQSLVDKSLFRKELVVADCVYNPVKTKLVLEAEAAGCKALGGVGMLQQQGVVNYKLFTGKDMPLDEYNKYQAEQSK